MKYCVHKHLQPSIWCGVTLFEFAARDDGERSGRTEGGWNRHAGRLKDLPERALDLAADHIGFLVDGDRRLVEVIEIANDVGPLQRPAMFFRLFGRICGSTAASSGRSARVLGLNPVVHKVPTPARF